MCKHGTNRTVWVKVPADLSYPHHIRWKRVKIDSCIADIVQALQTAGIDMRASCCGHGRARGTIHLQDGRILEFESRKLLAWWMDQSTLNEKS